MKKKLTALAVACMLITTSVCGGSVYATKPAAPKSDVVQGEFCAEVKDSSAETLGNKKICWGQGKNFDEQNRPRDAVNAQTKYGESGGDFIDTSGEKVIYLTFDEGYENGYTAKILDVLKQKGVKATFFVTGDYAKSESDLMKRMVDEGHVIGNHTWRHYSMPEKSDDICRDEIKQLHDYVKENYGYEMTVMRPPKGEFSERTLAVAKDMGYRTMLWSFAYKDWDAKSHADPTASLNKLNERLHPGAIYLLHAVSPTNADILGDFIDHAQAEGYRFIIPAIGENKQEKIPNNKKSK